MKYTRRTFLHNLAATGLLTASGPWSLSATSIVAYGSTIAALREGIYAELKANTRYRIFGADAASEGYQGIAYMFGAIALSELIHAQNYNRVLGTLGQRREEPAEVLPVIGTTKENVITAMEAEIAAIDEVYPALMAGVNQDELAIAVQNVRYSWESHIQHREALDKIRRYSPSHFETVARRIDKKSTHYYVCQICGSVQVKLPEDHCPICQRDPSLFDYVDPEMLMPTTTS